MEGGARPVCPSPLAVRASAVLLRSKVQTEPRTDSVMNRLKIVSGHLCPPAPGPGPGSGSSDSRAMLRGSPCGSAAPGCGEDVVVVHGRRTAIGRAKRGAFKVTTRNQTSTRTNLYFKVKNFNLWQTPPTVTLKNQSVHRSGCMESCEGPNTRRLKMRIKDLNQRGKLGNQKLRFLFSRF